MRHHLMAQIATYVDKRLTHFKLDVTRTGDGQFIGANAYNDGNQSIPNTVITPVALNSDRWDTDNMHDTVVNNSRLTCRTAGKYLISCTVTFAGSSGGTYRWLLLTIMQGGANKSRRVDRRAPIGTNEIHLHFTTVEDLAPGDYAYMEVYQDSGGPLDLVLGEDYGANLIMVKVG